MADKIHKTLRRLVFMALLTAMSLCIWIIESQIPLPIAVPYIKLGLASVITLETMLLLNRRDALIVLLVRIVLSCLFSSNPSVILYSLAGGILSWALMALTIKLFPEGLVWVVSVFGSIGHNAGQLIVAWLLLGPVWAYAPVLLIAAIVTGVFTGVTAMLLYRALKKHIRF